MTDKGEIHNAQVQGIIFKKVLTDEEREEAKRVHYSDYLRGTHHSASAKMKAGFKYKKTKKNQLKNDKRKK